jgi:hypothetical protein
MSLVKKIILLPLRTIHSYLLGLPLPGPGPALRRRRRLLLALFVVLFFWNSSSQPRGTPPNNIILGTFRVRFTACNFRARRFGLAFRVRRAHRVRRRTAVPTFGRLGVGRLAHFVRRWAP